MAAIVPIPGREAAVLAQVTAAVLAQNLTSAVLSVYTNETVPARLHYSHNRRIPPIVVLMSEGWTMVVSASSSGVQAGGHGYDNTLDSMQALFLAEGPAFKRGVVLDGRH